VSGKTSTRGTTSVVFSTVYRVAQKLNHHRIVIFEPADKIFIQIKSSKSIHLRMRHLVLIFYA